VFQAWHLYLSHYYDSDLGSDIGRFWRDIEDIPTGEKQLELPPIPNKATPALDKVPSVQALKDREIALNFRREKSRHFEDKDDDAEGDDLSEALSPARPLKEKSSKKSREKVSMLQTLRGLQPRHR
jgi:hypothetical protein